MSIVTLRTKETWRCGCGWITHGPASFCRIELNTHRAWTKCPERMESHRSFVLASIDEHRAPFALRRALHSAGAP